MNECDLLVPIAVAGNLDEPNEEFEIILPAAVTPGNYLLRLYTTNAASQNVQRAFFPLTVIDP